VSKRGAFGRKHRGSDRCACGNPATHEAAGPRCEKCKRIEDGWANKAKTHAGMVTRLQLGLEPYTVLLPKGALLT